MINEKSHKSSTLHTIYKKVKLKQSHYRPGQARPWGFQEFEAPRFQDNRHMKVVRLSALSTGRFYPQEIFLVLIFARGWVNPKDIVRTEWICRWKIPMTPSEIEPATFRLVAQCYRVPPRMIYIFSNNVRHPVMTFTTLHYTLPD